MSLTEWKAMNEAALAETRGEADIYWVVTVNRETGDGASHGPHDADAAHRWRDAVNGQSGPFVAFVVGKR